jgi:hypothetical protein
MTSKGQGFGGVIFRKKPAPVSAGAGAAVVDMEAREEDMFPDYGFPIVYHLICSDEYNNGNFASLNNYIVVQTHACNRTEYPRVPHLPSFISPSEVCVLFMRWDASAHLDTLRSAADKHPYYTALNDVVFLNKHVMGHAKVLYNQPYLAIYNFCKHSVMVTPHAITARATNFGPIGFAMFTALLTAVQLIPNVPPDSILWLAIDLDNPLFSKVANIYTVCGFSNPIITNRDVSGAVLQMNVLQLTRPLHAHVGRHLESVDNFNQVMNLWHNFTSGQLDPVINWAGYSARVLKYRFSFDRSCIMSLRLFPYVAFNAQGAPVNVSDTDAQRETSGKFLSIKSEHDTDNPAAGHDVFALETVANGTEVRIVFNVGTATSVPIVHADATFHTHPILNYRNLHVAIAPPSDGDFFAFVSLFVFFQSRQEIGRHQSFKFSVISTVEGLYIISLSPDGITHFTNMVKECSNMDEFDAQAKMITDTYAYNMPRVVWRDQPLDEYRSMAAVQTLFGNYNEWFNTTNETNGNLFELQFVSWDEFTTRDTFEVYYLENRINLP